MSENSKNNIKKLNDKKLKYPYTIKKVSTYFYCIVDQENHAIKKTNLKGKTQTLLFNSFKKALEYVNEINKAKKMVKEQTKTNIIKEPVEEEVEL